MPRTDPRPTSFLTLEPGTPVVDRFGQPVGDVKRVLIVGDRWFDGIIVGTAAGSRFVDAPEVRRIHHGTVTLGVTTADVEAPGSDGPRICGVPQARHGRVHATEADRDAAIEGLKRAFVRDELATDELGERVSVAHLAHTLDELDAVLDGLTEED